jgi:hypothetical protein
MEGFGSGIWLRYGAKRTTDEFPTLDVRELKRAGPIDPRQERVEDGCTVR